MFRPWRFLLVIFLFAWLLLPLLAFAYNNPGQPQGFVNDYASILSEADQDKLEQKLVSFKASSTNEISVVTIKSLEGDTIENFAVKLFADWKIGQEKQDNGLLLLIAVDDRKMRLEVGYGLEGAVPDATANQIITKTLKPAFGAQKYYEGIDQALDSLIAATNGEYQAETTPATSSLSKRLGFDTLLWILIFVFYGLSALWRYLAKSRSWWQGGAIGGGLGLIVALFFFRTLLLIILIPTVIAVVGLIADYLVSRVFPQPKPLNKKRSNFWFLGGPGGFGGGSSGGGFGGFGGGSSGGGGAGGSW